MVFKSNEFLVPNIANIPNDRRKLVELIDLFKDKPLSLSQAIDTSSLPYSKQTLRKVINHSTYIGILMNEDRRYVISEETIKLLNNENNLYEYLAEIVSKNKEVFRIIQIILNLLLLFSPGLKQKTLYSIFSLVGMGRTDKSAESSVGRNLRAVFNILNMMGIIFKKKNIVHIQPEKAKTLLTKVPVPIKSYFHDDVVNIKDITEYLNKYFEKNVSRNILTCTATYELDQYIWVKSSLYKNQGEIKSLYDEFIMTVIMKRGT